MGLGAVAIKVANEAWDEGFELEAKVGEPSPASSLGLGLLEIMRVNICVASSPNYSPSSATWRAGAAALPPPLHRPAQGHLLDRGPQGPDL